MNDEFSQIFQNVWIDSTHKLFTAQIYEGIDKSCTELDSLCLVVMCHNTLQHYDGGNKVNAR